MSSSQEIGLAMTRSLSVVAASILLGALSTVSIVHAQNQALPKPLLQEGKKSLHQRVLTTPDCALFEKIGDANGQSVPAFSRYYVYERADNGGLPWIGVGPDTKGNMVGWLDEACTFEWKMQLTLAFTNPAGRSPVLFFENQEKVQALVDSELPAMAIAPIMAELDKTGKASGVVAKEPELAVDQRQNFYLLPIFESEELYTQAGEPMRALNVASVTKKDQATEEDKSSHGTSDPSAAADQQSSLKAFSAAVVFVIDSTISMGPYIERTREAVRSITKQIDSAGLGDQVKFGLVAYRGNVDAVSGLEYVSKLYVDPVTVISGTDFLKKIADLKPAEVSTPSFNEDTYAGLSTAIDDIDWKQFGARYMVLITDAGAITGQDKLSTTQLDAAQVRLAAKEKGIALYTLHLKTPTGKRNHPIAQAQYEELTFNEIVGKSLYYPVDAGSVDGFGQMVDGLASSIVDQAKLAYEGETAAGSALAAKTAEPTNDPVETLKRDARALGHAMQLAYLGEKQGTQAPNVFTAWVLDRDLANPSRPTTEVRVLVTKNELSDMSATVQSIVDAANQSHISPTKMFEQLRSVAATMGRDPSQLNQSDQTNIAELGLIGEYLEGLPYQSDVLNLDEQTWKSWSAAQQQQFIRNLSGKLALYRSFNADLDRWVALAPDADVGDNVYPVPLEALP
jgi:serine/threonine-protein kinase PpkA